MNMHRTVSVFPCLLALMLACLVCGNATAGTTTVQVDSHAGPWNYTDGGLNTAFKYGFNDFTSPVVIDSSSGFNFVPGQRFVIQSHAGQTSAGFMAGNAATPYPLSNANGYTGLAEDDNAGSTGLFFPSRYINPNEYPAYLNALVGTFTDRTGAIVGKPFKIGTSASPIVPVGATRLQLGINDDNFHDNSGALTVTVSGNRSVQNLVRKINLTAEQKLPATAIPLPKQTFPSGNLNFGFPIRSTSQVQLITEAGGVSSDCSGDYSCYDVFHAPNAAFYALDFDVPSGITNDVVAAKPGTIVSIVRDDNPATTYDDRAVIIYHGSGYFTKYGEFPISDSIRVGQQISEQEYENGVVLGALTGATKEHLHFQVEHNDNDGPTNFGTNLSRQSNLALKGTTVGGVLMTDYKLNRDPSRTGTINFVSGQPLPLTTRVNNLLPIQSKYTVQSNRINFDTSFADPFRSLGGTVNNLGNGLSLTTAGSTPSGRSASAEQPLSVALAGQSRLNKVGTVSAISREVASDAGSNDPVYFGGLVSVDSSADFISFNASFDSSERAIGLLSIFWDDVPVGTIDERYALEGLQRYIFDLPGTYDTGTYTLAFRLDSFSNVPSSVTVTDFHTGSFSTVPEPAMAVPMFTGIALLLRSAKKRRMTRS